MIGDDNSEDGVLAIDVPHIEPDGALVLTKEP